MYCANVLAGVLCRISFIISEFSFAVNVIRGSRRGARTGMKYMRKREKYTYKRNTEARLSDHYCSGKTMSFTYLECVCVCVCSLRYPACNVHAPYCHLWSTSFYIIFPHFFINDKIFGEKNVNENKICVLIPLHLLSETFLIIRRTERDMITNVYWSSCKVLVILVQL